MQAVGGHGGVGPVTSVVSYSFPFQARAARRWGRGCSDDDAYLSRCRLLYLLIMSEASPRFYQLRSPSELRADERQQGRADLALALLARVPVAAVEARIYEAEEGGVGTA